MHGSQSVRYDWVLPKLSDTRPYAFARPRAVEFIDPRTHRARVLPIDRIDPAGVGSSDPSARAMSRLALVNLEQLGLGQLAVRRDVGEHRDGACAFRFSALEREPAQRLVRWIREARKRGELGNAATSFLDRERIKDPERIRRVLSLLHDRGALRLDRPTAVGTLERFEGPFSMFELEVPAPGNLPPFIDRTRARRERRVPVDPRVTFVARHPSFGGVHIRRGVRDVSQRGLSIWAHAEEDLLWPGLQVDFELAWRAGPPLRLQGIVRHVTPMADTQVDLVGFELLRPDPIYTRTLDRMLHPTTSSGTANPEALWDLYEESGYFSLSGKRRDDFRPLAKSFRKAERKLAASPALGAHFVTPIRGPIDASIHHVQLWERTWLIYNLARSGRARSFADAGHQALSELYRHAYEYAQGLDPHWLVNYVQKVASWSRKVHFDIPNDYVDAGEASVTTFRALELSTESVFPADTIRVRRLTEPTLGEVSETLGRQYPRPFIEALGLHELSRNIDPRRLWRDAGLHRRRELLAAYGDDGLEAVAVLDAVESGLHLFRLADACRIFAVGNATPAAYGALLTAASAWYGAQRKPSYVYFEEEAAPDLDTMPRAGRRTHRDLGAAWMTVLDARRIPELLERLDELVTRPHPLLER